MARKHRRATPAGGAEACAPAPAQVHRQTIKREEKVERVQGEFAVTDPMRMKASLLTPKPTDSTPSVESACAARAARSAR